MPPPKVHDAALRATLLVHTSRLIAENGPEAVSLRAAAAAAGTSTSAVYALFGSRDVLLAAVAHEAVTRFAEHLAAVDETDDAVEDLLSLGMAYRASALDDPHFYRVMFDAGPSRLHRVGRDEPTFGVLQRAVQRCVDAGATAEKDAERMATTLWALVHGLVQLELAGLLDTDVQRRAHGYQHALQDIWIGMAKRTGTESR